MPGESFVTSGFFGVTRAASELENEQVRAAAAAAAFGFLATEVSSH